MTANDTPGAEPLTEAVMDYPAAWEFVRGTDPADHNERCSWRSTGGAFICDCSVIWIEYGRRKERQAAARAAVQPAGDLAALRTWVLGLQWPKPHGTLYVDGFHDARQATLDHVDDLIAASHASAPREDSGLREAVEDAIALLEAAPSYLWTAGEPDETIAALRVALAATPTVAQHPEAVTSRFDRYIDGPALEQEMRDTAAIYALEHPEAGER